MNLSIYTNKTLPSSIQCMQPARIAAHIKSSKIGDIVVGYRRKHSTARSHPLTTVAATDFHQSRLAADNAPPAIKLPQLEVTTRLGDRDDELEAAAWLRSRSFYAYPPERKFAGELHQIMMADEEFKSLKASRLSRKLDQGKEGSRERSACLLAVCPREFLENSNSSDELELDEHMTITDDGINDLVVVGTLDLYAVKALEGEWLIGNCDNPAYLANVCTAEVARRRNVGGVLLNAARDLAREWGVDGLYVHTMAVNEIAVRFYERNGFVVDKEETSNQAHYRGRCLDGVEGKGRVVLLKDTRL